MKKLIIFLTIFFVGITVAFGIGARVGVSEFLYADAQYRASIFATQLQALRAGKSESIITELEIALNGELANHGRYMESNLTWLWPHLKSKDDRPIRKAVTYRMTNSYEDPDLSKPENWKTGMDMNNQFVKDIIEGQKILNRYIQKTLKQYEDVTHNSSKHQTPKTAASEGR